MSAAELVYCSSYELLPELLDLYGTRAKASWFRLLGQNWSSCDNVGLYAKFLDPIFNAAQPHEIHAMMTAKERKAWGALPNEVVAYRGCYQVNRVGFSYSLNEETARKFPNLQRYKLPGHIPILRKVRLPKTEVVLKLDRNEEEVIAISRHTVRVISESPLDERGEAL